MAITTSLGVGSGIDIAGTVSQLTAAEGKPQLDAIATKSSISQAKLSGLGTLKGALSTFQNAVKMLSQSSAFETQQITSSDEKILKVSVAPGSIASSHTVKVNALATPQKSISTTEFKSTDTVAEGTLTFTDKDGASKFSVVTTKGVNDSLAGLRDAINNAKGNTSVLASVVNVDAKNGGGTISKLVLSAKVAGSESSFSVDASLGDKRFNLSATSPGNFSTTVATDANVTVDEQPVAAIPQHSVSAVEFGANDVVAPGVISFQDSTGKEKFSVDITKGVNDKIFTVKSAINNAVGNTSIVADIINVESKTNPGTTISKLVFTSKQPGTENSFKIDASKGDARLSLDGLMGDAQKSVSATEFNGSSDKVSSGTIAFKDASGLVSFSIEVKPDATVTTTTGNLDADGNPITTVVTDTGTVDADGNPITTTTTSPGIASPDGVPVTTVEVKKGENNTLAALVDAINYAPDNKLVSASIITVDSTTNPGTQVSKLVLTAQNGGVSKGFSIDATAGDKRLTYDPIATPDSFVNSTTVAAYDTTEASNANDGGMSITRSSNSISDAIPGVTMTLVDKGTAKLDSRLDQAAISQPISTFVDAYNKLNETLKQLTVYVKPGDSGNGPLLGDSTIQTITTQLKSFVNGKVSTATGDFNSLNQLGVTFDKNGVMTLDSTVLNKSITTNLTSVSNIFASKEGIAVKINTSISQYLDAKGSLTLQQDSLNKQLVTLTTEKAAVEARLATSQKSLQKQFIAMDTAVSQFKNTGTFLTQALTPKTNN